MTTRELGLYELFYRLCNNHLALYFNFLFPNVTRNNYNLRNESIKLPLTRRTFSIQSNKYQLHLFLRTTLHKYSELADTSSMYAYYTKLIKTFLSVRMIQTVLFQITMSNCYVIFRCKLSEIVLMLSKPHVIVDLFVSSSKLKY